MYISRDFVAIKHLDLFSGIGGFALAADRVFGNVEHIFCDNELFAQEVLKKHWPEAQIYGDIRTLTANTERERDGREVGYDNGAKSSVQSTEKTQDAGINETRDYIAESRVDLLTGGFPCQPFSQAGRRRGEEDDRFLWPEMLRVIREFSPLWVIAENVRGLLTQGGGVVFERVCTDLEAAGYEVQPLIIPAVALGAPHRRDRVWFVANKQIQQHERSLDTRTRRSRFANDNSYAPNTKSRPLIQTDKTSTLGRSNTRQNSRGDCGWDKQWLEVATRLCRVDDGVPRRLDRNPRLKALGNAIVPQVAEEIMRAIVVRH